MVDPRPEGRGLPDRPPDLDARPPPDFVIPVKVNKKTGDIDNHELRRETVKHPAGPLEVDPDLVDPVCDRTVELEQGRSVKRWVDAEVVSDFEPDDAQFQFIVEQLGIIARNGQIPREQKPLS